VTTTDAFPPEEYGSGSRPTPLGDAPAWLKAQARGETDRATLAPAERAFLESIPSYDEERSLPSVTPPWVATPSLARSIASKLLFVAIAGGASAILGLAVMRMLGRLFP
jgi:hypothetical protein